METPPSLRGRGSASNPKNRFESIERVPDPPEDGDDISSPHTLFFPDSSKSIIAYNDSPDVGFDASVNPYRGCEHGCVYCYARPTMSISVSRPAWISKPRSWSKTMRRNCCAKNCRVAEMEATVGRTERRHGLLSAGGKTDSS